MTGAGHENFRNLPADAQEGIYHTLQKIRARRQWTTVAAVVLILVTLFFVIRRPPMTQLQGTLLATVLTVLWLIMLGSFTGYIFTLCPNCGQSFFSRRWYGNAFANACVHCGLPIAFVPDHRCPRCHHDLRGHTHERCPGCGRKVSPEPTDEDY